MEYTFAPGPSQLWPGLARHMAPAADSGVLSMSHRSPRFSEIYEAVLQGFRDKLGLPQGWSLYFLSSATECWQVIALGLITQNALHLYNGAFGERWHQYAQALVPGVRGVAFSEQADIDALQSEVLQPVELLCFIQNETSTGSQVPLRFLSEVRGVLQEQLIALDATSSMGGQQLPWQVGDVWFASVQKCFGLPAGLGIMVCSPQAQARIARVDKQDTYNGLARIHKHYLDRQTSYTPSVLHIYLLALTACNGGTSEPQQAPEAATTPSYPDSLYLQKGQSYALRAQMGLQQQLQAKLKAGGPAAAIPFCQAHALPITDSLARLQGVGIRRVTLSTRNPANSPDSIARPILTQWTVTPQAALPKVVRTTQEVRLYVPIRTAMPTCFQCHGSTDKDIAPATLALLKARYPQDLATGYALGDLRGAWEVRWPMGQHP